MYITDQCKASLANCVEPPIDLHSIKYLLHETDVRNLVDPDVDHGCAFLDMFTTHKAGPSDRRYENIRLTRDRSKIARPRMTNGYGRVLLKQKHRHRLAYDVAAADDHRVLTFDRYT